MTVREVEWSPDDLALVLASRRRANQRRGPHGYTLAESMDPTNQFAFDVTNPKRDWAMKALNDKQEQFYKQYPSAKGDPSFVWDVKKRE